jgi:hypothetical protein
MDDRRFDTLIRAFGQGGSRRSLLKGLLGLGGVTAAGTALLRDTEAARRGQSGPAVPTALPTVPAPPTEIPAPTESAAPSCPGNQTPCGTGCCCPAGNTKCGSDCCPDGQAQCCDGACCYGTCYGEELCCPSAQVFCAVSGQCCAPGETCGAAGCVSGTCGGIGAACTIGSDCCTPNVCADGACAAACPPGSRECDRVCYPGGCCADSDCGGTCLVCGSDHVCHSCAESGQCLTCDTGTGTCVAGCPTSWICQGSQCVVDCLISSEVCFVTEPGFVPPHPTCCGGGAMCDSCEIPGGQCVCTPFEGGGPGIYCPPPQFACCGTNPNGNNTCTCCASGQTCNSSGTAGSCSG